MSSIYRNVVWFCKGLREYTNNGYVAASVHFNGTDLDVDCSGKSYMITGANSGIGKQVAMEIAKRKGTVHLVCRNAESAQQARDEIYSCTGNDSVHVHIVDLSNLKAVRDFIVDFQRQHQQLDVLVNNAGCMVHSRQKTPEGVETNFATNTLATHLLSTRLAPMLLKSSDARLVTVTSGGMLTVKLDADDPQCDAMDPFNGTMVYAQNKRQQVVMAEYYARSYPSVFVATVHPGWTDTPAVRTAMPDFYNRMKDRLRTVQQGADSVLWLAVAVAASANKENSGQFYQDRMPVAKHLPLAWTKSTPEQDERFIAYLDRLVRELGL